ncbi:YrzA family protein [Bacillus sp. FJAT-45037]|uniref:YrzA family protein n=1 Tax=Bacillus sp. FJAT-45037 TaxID=2011007 RepID=UPI000C231A8E|nr:YrzA family protein [Bacillus sp. FJAT-45037]
MSIQLERIEDKIECFETPSFKELEQRMNDKIEHNKALLLEVASVNHHIYPHVKTGQPIYTAVVHFKAKQL